MKEDEEKDPAKIEEKEEILRSPVILGYLGSVQKSILDPLVANYNVRMPAASRLSQITADLFFLPAKVGDREIHFMIYTNEKLLFDRVVSGSNAEELKKDMRVKMGNYIIHTMRYGLNYLIRRASSIPEFLI